MRFIPALLLLLSACHAHGREAAVTTINQKFVARSGVDVPSAHGAFGVKRFSHLRGGGLIGKSTSNAESNDIGKLVKSIFTPRVALKVITMGLASFALPALVAPKLFRDLFFSTTPPTDLLDTFQALFGLRELLASTTAWLISTSGSDDLCRNFLTAVFFILSPLQTFILATSTSVNPDQRAFLVGFQVVIGLYLFVTSLLAWTNKANSTLDSIKREVRKKK